MSAQEDKSLQDLLGRSAESFDDQGLAGKTARAFIRSPITPLLLLLSLFVGIVGLMLTPRQEDPQISVPLVDIMVSYPGSSAEQANALVAQPLERALHEIPGVDHVYSVSRRGQAMVAVQFNVGEPLEESLVKVYDKLSSHRDVVPPGALEPIVKPKSVDDVPVVTFTLSSKDLTGSELRLLGQDVLQELSVNPGVSQGFVVGGQPRQVKVEILPERLSGYGVTLEQLGRTIQAANSETDLGKIEGWDKSFNVYTGSFLRSATDVANLMVAVHDGAPVYVRDVALVSEGDGDVTQAVTHYAVSGEEGDVSSADGAPAVTVAIAKKHGTNGVSVATAAIDKLEQLKGHLIPDNVSVTISRDYGKSANEKVNELIFKLFVATGAVTLLVWFFLGWRPAVVVAIVIPVVILVTVFIAWLGNYTIDRVSLFALIFSIGILVDDAVVVLENIYRRWLIDGSTRDEVSIDATAEVGNPTIVATLAVIAALMPMAFVSGMMGPYMEPIPSLGSAAMAFSLFAAFAFTPWLASRIKPSLAELERAAIKEHKQSERIERFFRRLLGSLVLNKAKGWLFLVGIIVAFFLSVLLLVTNAVTVKLLPFDNKSDFAVVINFPEGIALPVTASLTEELVQALRKVPEVTSMESYVGTASPFDFNGLVRHYYMRSEPWQADIQVHLLGKKERHRSSHEIAEAVRPLLKPFADRAGARIQIVETPPGPPVLQAVVAEVYGPDADTRRKVAADLTTIFKKSDNIADVDNLMQAPYDIWRFEVDVSKAVRRGISIDVINKTLAMAMGNFHVGDAKQGLVREAVYIVLQVPQAYRTEFARLGQIPVPSQMGGTVPLAELGHFIKDTQQQVIYHKDLQPIEYVIANTVGRLGAPIYGMLQVEDELKNYVSPDGVKVESSYAGAPKDAYHSGFEWTGEWTVTYETFRDMGLAFGVALVLIYMLVVWEFKNFMVPVIVMAPIPLTLIGIIPGHWLIGAEFTATSMIGFIALAGIIVRNSLLLVDFARQEIAKGVPIVDAVIYSCQARTRPILITGAALVLGSSVILFDPIFQGMAVSLMFGVVVSTMLTLIVIPLGCVTARTAMCATMNHGLPNPPAACSAPLDVHLDSPEHAGDIHVHPVHLPVAPVGTLDKHSVEPQAEATVHAPPQGGDCVAELDAPKIAQSSSTVVALPVIEHEEKPLAPAADKSSTQDVVELPVATPESTDSHSAADVPPVEQVTSPVATEISTPAVADVPIAAPVVKAKPVARATRAPRTSKAAVTDETAVAVEKPKPVTSEEPKRLSKRPRRGIKIKGQE
jgi:multidrug efflux pump subunit AcrB